MARTTRELKRELEQLGGVEGVNKDNLPLLSVCILMSAEEFRDTDVDGVMAVDLEGNGEWELHRTMDLENRTDMHGYQMEGPDE